MNIRYILGAPDGAPIAQVLSTLRSQSVWRPFDERAVAFVRRFSQKLLTSAGIRQHPELAALGHWFRGANLQTLAEWLDAARVTEGLLASVVFTLWVLWTAWAVKLDQPGDPRDPRTATPVSA